MKTSKLMVFAASALMSFGLFADAANVLISFSTPGPDTYADGTQVLDGERYALVWSKDGVFEGLKTDCTAVDPNDEVIFIASLAKGGHCPFTVFQIDSKSSKAKTTGIYEVYLLDTRTANKAAIAGLNESELPSAVNGAIASQKYKAGAATSGGAKAQEASVEVAWAATDVVIPEGAEPAKISAIQVKNGKVELTVENMLPGVQYNVRMGKNVNKLENFALTVPKTVADKPTFVIDEKDAQFFQVVREPLKK